MQTRRMLTPTSQVRLGHARTDITPPVGIYHRMWGAARHERATGVHRPLLADVLLFAPLAGESDRWLRVELDLVGLAKDAFTTLVERLGQAANVAPEQVIITFTHTHAAGWMAPDRVAFAGGELIPDYLRTLTERVEAACREAASRLEPVTITYGQGHCGLAQNRDTWDEAFGGYVCGTNPGVPADDALIVGRATNSAGQTVCTLVNYACHPTTLAWENTLISPDYVGAMRTLVEAETKAPCVFLQGACGDLGPREGFVGDTAVADRNGRELGYAALGVLASMGPAGRDFAYLGPVISGATLGTWGWAAPDPAHAAAMQACAGTGRRLPLRLKERPDAERLQAEIAEWEARKRAATERGDDQAARDAGAYAERARRWLGRVNAFPPGDEYPLRTSVHRLGDAIWVTCGGEPYNLLQTELRRRFPDTVILVSPLFGEMTGGYLLPEDRYGQGLYQEEPSVFAPACLERVIEAIAAEIERLLAQGGATD